MSIKSWKKEFCPTSASRCRRPQAIAHSLQTWKGRRRDNLDKHKLAEPPIAANHGNCALCVCYREAYTCGECPLFRILGNSSCGYSEIYDAWDSGHDPEPMIAALEMALMMQGAKKPKRATKRKGKK